MISIEYTESIKNCRDKKILCDGCLKEVDEKITEVYMGFKELGLEENRVRRFVLCKDCLGELLLELEKLNKKFS